MSYIRKHSSNLNSICNCLQLIYTITNLLGPDREWIYSYQSFWLLFDYLSNLFYPLSNSLESSSSIHPLQICCVVLTRPISLYILGLDFKTCPYIYIYIYIYTKPRVFGAYDYALQKYQLLGDFDFTYFLALPLHKHYQ